MPYYCTVPRCTSMAGKAKNVSFHQFPRDEELAKLWNKILKRGKPYTKYSKVCSLHFTPEDYTITSVGKNKGQWRTLRKDAIPSQNLPSESPTPYQRKQWSSWTRDPPSNLMDPSIHHQVAQAIYMQTMLAMQAAGATDMSTLNHTNGLPTVTTEAFAHTSATPDTDILKGKQTNTHAKSNSFKCAECSKCFKDPDVYILHKRSHIKNEKNEKENFNLNLTLQANPILANLLKTNTENSNIFDTNFSVESLLMTALAANMEGYMRNFTSMIKSEERGNLDHDTGQLDHDSGNLDHDSRDRGSYDQNDRRGLIQDCQSTSQSVMDNSSLENDREVMNQDGDLMNRDSNVFNDRIIEHFRNNTYDSNRSVRYYEHDANNGSGSANGDVTNCDDMGMIDCDRSKIGDDHNNMIDDGVMTTDDSGMVDRKKGMMDHDRGMMDHDRSMMDRDRGMLDDRYGDGVTNNDSQSSSDGQICDNDINGSIDSNRLVIDETV